MYNKTVRILCGLHKGRIGHVVSVVEQHRKLKQVGVLVAGQVIEYDPWAVEEVQAGSLPGLLFVVTP